MRYIHLLTYAFALCLPINLYSKSFVVKKKKSVSMSTLKNNCCDACTQVLETSAKLVATTAAEQLKTEKKETTLLMLMQVVGKLQQQMLTKIRCIIENTRDCFFTHGSKQELQTCIDKTNECHDMLLLIQGKIKKGTYKNSDLKRALDDIQSYTEYVQNI